MSLQEEIMQLLILLKKTTNKDDKILIKNKLKSLYNKLNTRAKKPKKTVKFNLPYKEEVKEVINPLRQQFLNLSQELKQRKIDLINQISKKEQKIRKIKDEDEKDIEKQKLEKLKDEKEIIDKGIKNKENPEQVFEEINVALNSNLPTFAKWLYTREKDEDKMKEKLFDRYLKINMINRKELEKNKVQIQKVVSEINRLVETTGLEYLRAKEEREEREQIAKEEKERKKLEKQRFDEERKQQEKERKARELAEKQAKREQLDVFGALEVFKEPTQKGFASALPAEEEEDISENVSKRVIKMVKDLEKLQKSQGQFTPAEYNRKLEQFFNKKSTEIGEQELADLKKLMWNQLGTEFGKTTTDFISTIQDIIFDPKRGKDESERQIILDNLGRFSFWINADPKNPGVREMPPTLLSLEAPPEQKGQGRKRKIKQYNIMDNIHGGAGIADWMMTLGSIPGVPQLMNNMGPFGQILGNASGLAQSFGKTAGQLMKEQSKDGEKIAGFTDTITSPLGGLTKMFGFGKKLKTHLTKGGSMKDFFNKHKKKLLAVGIPTIGALGGLLALGLNKSNTNTDKVIPPLLDEFGNPSPSKLWGYTNLQGSGLYKKLDTHLLKGGSIKDFWNKHKKKLLAIGIPSATMLGSLGLIALGNKGIADKEARLNAIPEPDRLFAPDDGVMPRELENERPQYIFGNGKKKLNMADMAGGAFLSDVFGTLGGITPKISGVVGKIPVYGKVGTIGNSALGSFSRVGEDIAKMLGLGNIDLTGKTKGYGRKKGGRKMLPKNHPLYQHGRPMPRIENEMAYIQPYGLEAEPPFELNGGYSLTDSLYDGFFDFAGTALKEGAKGLANVGVKLGKELAKTGVQKLADQATTAIGNGKRRKLKGKGKINGKYVSSEYEANYEDALSKNKLINEMARMNAEQQMEQAILNQQNMEQATALSQLQYHDLLRKIQRENQ